MIKNTVLTKTFHFRAWTKSFLLWKWSSGTSLCVKS